ncbi:MAG TPA: polyphenol oxidase family protein [Ornithinimicrobium sp.]|uniref:polyphenol oxidase family protein n=1 Tax=Ornithinimicrobium sp. TaxID=1977084 RepID=UPI002B466F31|nr:polyphenol oxidase family protein [Ornithinimicrobium sp.]HKJ11945.1 polyphenol oxidase family protein [Ornithinimicrobium sp.]
MNLTATVFRWRDRLPPAGPGQCGVEWAVTDRFGGRSRGRFGELNLGAGVQDDPVAVAGNRSLVARELGVSARRLRFMRQQHGTTVEWVEGPAPTLGSEPECDAQATDEPDLALAVLVADCTPVLLADPAKGLVAAVHAGRVGMSAGVVPRCIEVLRQRGAEELKAVVGPSICGRCYEVPEQMRSECSAWSAAASVSWVGTPALDVAAAVVQQLTRDGVSVQWLPGCTRESGDLYSHRGDPRTGRFAATVRLLPEAA